MCPTCCPSQELEAQIWWVGLVILYRLSNDAARPFYCFIPFTAELVMAAYQISLIFIHFYTVCHALPSSAVNVRKIGLCDFDRIRICFCYCACFMMPTTVENLSVWQPSSS
ncbi:hypothetical protein FJT64_007983 [Amphibalanus amphitrite]|uniref:Uncharacterized protein n=1 Tax=Amphibalanus amphitrite TaxID=1232801 RepID=A0A6A4VN30_AMPAM|nr:hypothetical protein FJT64_007983 [Amphibalanus amphitrite]KAF0294349.1 hypothetical protein FJT64_007983 [Amphibalanus amphitrite]